MSGRSGANITWGQIMNALAQVTEARSPARHAGTQKIIEAIRQNKQQTK